MSDPKIVTFTYVPTPEETQDYIQWMTTGEDLTPAELLERVLQRVLKAYKIPQEDRGALEVAVKIARDLQKKTKEPRP